MREKMENANIVGEHPVRVYYEDVDLGGIVYHSKYLNFCERARSEFFFSRGLSPVAGEYHFVVKHIDASFRASARFSDLLIVRTEYLDRRKASFTLRQRVLDERREKTFFEMDVELVCLRGERVAAIPPGMIDLFEHPEGRKG
jgi:acyl-CoA thioester hydrolase